MKVISTDKAPQAIGPYSQGIISGGLFFSSGQIAIDPVTGELKVTLPFLGAITLLDKSAVDENEIETKTTDAGAADTETAAE